jgi:hypothetical protein
MIRRDPDCPPSRAAYGIHIHTCIVSIPLGLEISRSRTTRDNLHTLFTLFRCRQGTFITGLVVVVQDNDFSERVLNLIAHFPSFVSPLFEFGKRDVLDVLPGLHPGTSFEQLVIVCIDVANMSHHRKLYSAGQGQLLRITYPVGSLLRVSKLPRKRYHQVTSSKA